VLELAFIFLFRFQNTIFTFGNNTWRLEGLDGVRWKFFSPHGVLGYWIQRRMKERYEKQVEE
jgi:hypothetical protein